MTPRTDRLDPVRFTAPRTATLVRGGLVALLLGLAAALLYADPVGTGPGTAGAGGSPPPAGSRPALPAGLVGAPVRLADPAALAVVRPGDRVDLLAVPPESGAPAVTVATGALVLDAVSGPDAAVLYLALGEVQARAAAGAGPDVRFGVIVRAQ